MQRERTGAGSGFRVVEHEYVFDETVSRRFVRRYHLSGVETILFFLALCKNELVRPDRAGGPRITKKTRTLIARRLGEGEKETEVSRRKKTDDKKIPKNE